ncbi:MAG TPA: sulfatase-like hydrolase/transferase [Sedimentisphaerales bacterium]|nr:sulfatase-like hydrolase/transferase [Sedimentisphaerales bacterium]
MNEKERCRITLSFFYLFAYVITLVNCFGYLKTTVYFNPLTSLFIASIYLVYPLIYILPAMIITELVRNLLWLKNVRLSSPAKRWILYTVVITAYSLTEIVVYVDKFIFHLYGFHLNGFVWNIITTNGGISSLGTSGSTIVSFVLIVWSFITILGIFLFISSRLPIPAKNRVALKVSVLLFIGILFLFQGAAYGISSFKGFSPILISSNTLPLYMPITFRNWAKSLGFKNSVENNIKIKLDKSFKLNYPLNPIERTENSKKYNIVWLVAESLRADMLNEKIMPATWKFAQKSARFTKHYSGGNGTRMGLFALFYGLYGNYWFNFLDEKKPPVLMDILQQDNYEMELFTSAKFTYPEFDKTIFANVPKEKLHSYDFGQGWLCDRKNVTDLIDFVKNRDTTRPFMTFLFFESPHARYYFPPECAIEPEYIEDFNYAGTDIKKNITLIKNRYINSCRHLDTQYERILNYLQEASLMEDTIIIITGDHGEEFMENGWWGHNSAYTDEQLLVPFVLWVPGREPVVIDRMTSHLDVPATLLKILGVKNPASDYSLGFDLFSDIKRDYAVVADWDSLGYIDSEYKAILPLKAHNIMGNSIYTSDYKATNSDDFFKTRSLSLVKILKECSTFNKNTQTGQ